MKDAGFVTRILTRISAFSFALLLFFPAILPAQHSKESQKASVNKKAQAPSEPSKPFHEDWTTLSLEHSTLQMMPPILVETDDIPNTGFIRERFHVNWRPSDPFDLYVVRPRGIEKTPVILYLYSFPDDTEKFKDNTWCESATSGGYAAVGFVSALTGHRTRFRLLKESLISEMQEALASTTHDVHLILDYLATRGDVDTNRVGMFGVGSGGSVVILASASDPRIGAVDLLGPWGDWPQWFAESKIVREEDRANLLKPEFLEKVAPLDPVVWLPRMKAKSVRMQNVRKNVSIPDKSQEKLEAAAPSNAVINAYGNGRAFMSAQPPIAIFDWMKDQLQPDAKPQVAVEKSERVHFFPAVEPPAQNWPNVGKLETGKPQTVAKGKEKEKEKPKDNQ